MGNEASVIAQSKADSSKSDVDSKKGPGQIVVVKEKPRNLTVSKESETISRLEDCPKFKPLVPNLLSRADARPLSSELVHQLSYEGTLRLCSLLQNHFQSCADSVKTDQSALCTKIKEVDKLALSVMQHLVERQRAFAKFTEHSQQVEEISLALDRVKANLQQASNVAHELNMLLPEQHRLQEL